MNDSKEQLEAIYTTIKNSRETRRGVRASGRQIRKTAIETSQICLPSDVVGEGRGVSSGLGFIRIKSTSRVRYKERLSLIGELRRVRRLCRRGV
jgi:hypothetical protein